MRILHVLDHSAPIQSGYAFRTLAILREQQKLGFITSQVTSPRHHDTAEFHVEKASGFTFRRSDHPTRFLGRLPVLKEYFLAKKLASAIAADIEASRPDVVHVHSPVLNLLPASRVCSKLGIPIVYEMRSLWEDSAVEMGHRKIGSPKYRLSKMLETFALKKLCDRVIVISEGLKKEIVSRGVSSEKISVVPNGVDLGLFAVNPDRDQHYEKTLDIAGKQVIGYAGSLHPYEGLGLLVEAFAKVVKIHPNARLVMLGDGVDKENLENQILRLELQQYVHLVGQVPHAEVGRYMSLMTAMAYPRKMSRLTDIVTPLKPLEAMAQGIPVIASNIGGHREMIKQSETGLLFEQNCVESLSDAICKVLGDEKLRSSLTKNAREYVERERTWASTVAVTQSVYAQCAVGGSANAN